MDGLVYLEPRADFDPMIIGVCENPHALCYDLDKIIDYWKGKFQESTNEEGQPTSDDEAYDMAIEWVDFNVLGAYFGPHTPLYISMNRYEMFKAMYDDD